MLKYVRIWILHAFIVGMLGRYTVADPETPRGGGGGGGGKFANKLIFFSENISIYINKVRTIILIKV